MIKIKGEIDMNDDMITGEIIALNNVQNQIDTMVFEMKNKGLEKPQVFWMLEQYIKDSINDLNEVLE